MGIKSFVFRFDDVEVREREFTLRKAGKELNVEPKAFRTLLFLLRNPQKLISKEELVRAVWGEVAVADGSLTRCIWLLRRALEDDINQPRYIETVPTIGYRFMCPVEASEESNGGNGGETEHRGVEPSGVSVQSKPSGAAAPGLGRWWLLAAAILLGGLVAGIWIFRSPAPPQDIARLTKITGDFSRNRYTPLASFAFEAKWSPDGRAVAYNGRVAGMYQIFIRYLNSPLPVQVTHEAQSVWLIGWLSDGNHLVAIEGTNRTGPPHHKLYTVAAVGGELDFVMDVDCDGCAMSRDGKVFATVTTPVNPGDKFSVAVSDPFGSTLKTYLPVPFARNEIDALPDIDFSPDGSKILLIGSGELGKDHAWLLPYPGGRKSPSRVIQELPLLQGSVGFSWMPDNRHVVIALATEPNSPTHLWIADTESDDLSPLTTGLGPEYSPSVSPDGKTIIFLQRTYITDIVSVSLADGSARSLVSSGRQEDMAGWSAKSDKMTWVTDRSGSSEIWDRSSDQTERPVVTAADFPGERNLYFSYPALSPDGDRLIFTKSSSDRGTCVWIMSLSGGPPVRLTNGVSGSEFGSKWSPDARQFIYLRNKAGKMSLMVVKTRGNETPVELRNDVRADDRLGMPDWSPAGDWITYRNQEGWNLISPDGKTTKRLGNLETNSLVFSKDGKQLYGILTRGTLADPDRATLFSLDPETLKQRVIKELGTDLSPTYSGNRFSLAPDGKSIAYSIVKDRRDLWMLQGYRQQGWWGRLSGIFK